VIVNTRRLFLGLLGRLRVDGVCDVGSMNGAEALAFRDALPESRIYAFEPNPQNFRSMAANPIFAARRVALLPFAATNRDGAADFFVVEADYSADDDRRGMSSLYARAGEWASSSVVSVRTIRLDSFLTRDRASTAPLALWIDSEGMAYEVIEGASGVAEQIQLIHAEVETTACIGPKQRLYGEVKALLERLGFMELATDAPRNREQFNSLYLRADLPAPLRWRIRASLLGARLRYLVVAMLLRFFPRFVARWRDRRIGAT